jgi:pimeloyl-ACP methyl ester carboxylesterase
MSIPGIGEHLVETVMQPEDVEAAQDGLEFLGHPGETVENLPLELVDAWYRMNRLPHFKRSWVSVLRRALNVRGASPEAAFTFDDLRNIRSPVLLLWGSNDPFGSVAVGQSGVEYFRDAEFHEVGVGHLPWLDEPEVCGALLRDVFTTQDRS